MLCLAETDAIGFCCPMTWIVLVETVKRAATMASQHL